MSDEHKNFLEPQVDEPARRPGAGENNSAGWRQGNPMRAGRRSAAVLVTLLMLGLLGALVGCGVGTADKPPAAQEASAVQVDQTADGQALRETGAAPRDEESHSEMDEPSLPPDQDQFEKQLAASREHLRAGRRQAAIRALDEAVPLMEDAADEAALELLAQQIDLPQRGSSLRGPDDSVIMRGMQVEPADESVQIGTFRLLAIGIDKYQDDRFPSLKSAAHGAKALKTVLTKKYTFKAQNSLVLTDAEATEQRIIRELRRLAQIAGKRDSIIVYYAGHGQIDALTQTGSWIPTDGRKDDASTWISNTRVKVLINAMKARHVLLISDSCFAGDFFRGSPKLEPDRRLMKSYRRMSRWVMTSGGLEPVTDGGRDGHSIFTFFLLKALSETDGVASLSETIFDRIKGSVRLNARQSPKFGVLHETGGEIDGQFVFFTKEARTDANLKWTALTPKPAVPEAAAPALPKYDAARQRLTALNQQIEALTEAQAAGKTMDVAELADLLADKKVAEDILRRLFQREFAQLQEILASVDVPANMQEKLWRAFLEKWEVGDNPEVGSPLVWSGKGAFVRGPRKDEIWTVPGLELTVVPVKPGTFWRPVNSRTRLPGRRGLHRQVRLTRHFWIGKYEVTQDLYQAVMERNPSKIRGGQHPVESVSWQNAVSFCSKVTAREDAAGRLPKGYVYRLPTEAEWEYACRAGSRSTFSFGDDAAQLERYAWVGRSAGNTHHPVGKKKANAWGIHDMHGNVFEWCHDGYDHYPNANVRDPAGPERSRYRVARGGSFGERSTYCGCSYRHKWDPSTEKEILGFRVVLAPKLE